MLNHNMDTRAAPLVADYGFDSLLANLALTFDKQYTLTDVTAYSKPLHILLVTETWTPDINGVAMSLGRLMQQISLQGHQVSLIRPKPKSSSVDMPIQGLTTQNLGEQSRSLVLSHDVQVKGMAIPKYANLQFGLPVYFTIKKQLKRIAPDVVHIATEGPLGWAALMAAKSLNIPVTTGYHTQFHDFSRHFGLGLLAGPIMAYFKWFHNASKATCVPSKKTLHDLQNLGFKRLVEVGRGVDLKWFNPKHRSDALRAQWGAHTHHTVLIMVSRLSPEKQIDWVIDAFKALQQQQLHRAVKLIIVGDGPDRDRLQAMAANNKEDIIFAGTQTGQALAEHYASADAFVFASQVETFGNVVVEAMASGLPVYAFDDAAAGMLVTPDSGRLVTLGDKAGFITAISQLPKMQCLKEQGSHARKSVAQCSWQRPTEKMLTMFYQALAPKATINRRLL